MPDRHTFPRPEYPRPDFQRGTVEGRDWLNLNGPWQFRFDPGKNGFEKGWHLPGDVEWREQIIVPFCWESLAAWGQADTAGNDNYFATRVYRNPLKVSPGRHCDAPRYEMGWYRRRVQVPANPCWKNKRIILKIGAADFFTDCWCNGFHVGRHEGGYTPFEFDLTKAIRRDRKGGGEALLVLRVENPMDNREQPAGKRSNTTASGIWQTVYLEPRETGYIEAFRVFPNIDRKNVAIEIQCVNTVDAHATLYLIPPGGEVKVYKTPVKEGVARRSFEIPAPYLWGPNHPNLYRMAIKLQQDKTTVDYVQSYFGMRKIDSGASESAEAPVVLRLNNVPRYLRGVLYQGCHPEGVFTAPDVARFQDDILAAKKFGFNLLRLHRKLEDPLLLYYADILGILVITDLPGLGKGGTTLPGRRRFEETLRAALRRDFNHPSLAGWGIPEPAGDPDDGSIAAGMEPVPAEASAWTEQMLRLARELDPTRFIEAVAQTSRPPALPKGGARDILSFHLYIKDSAHAREQLQKTVESLAPGPAADTAGPRMLLHIHYGGIGPFDGARDGSWSFKFLTNELRRHGAISACIYTQLHDVELEYNGLVTYNRAVKDFGYDPRWVNESDVLPVNCPPLSRHAPGSLIRVDVASSHFSSVARHNVSLRWRLTGVDTWGRFHQNLAGGIAPVEFPHRRVAPAHIVELKLPEKPMLCRLTLEAFEDNGAWVAGNFVDFFASTGTLPHRERADRSWLLRAFPHEWVEAYWSGSMSSPDEAAARQRCWGTGHGFFEWVFPLDGVDLSQAQRIRFVCEASARRPDAPQTNQDKFPTALHVDLNGVPICRQTISDHPHDARGVLSYLAGDAEGRGGYGYFVSAVLEHEALQEVVSRAKRGEFRVRLEVPDNPAATGGLTVYGVEGGRYPLPLLILVEG